MRIGIAGKGGVGKSIIAALLSRLWARSGRRVVAVDCDSDPHLALSAGLSVVDAGRMRPLLEQDGHQRSLASGDDPERLIHEFGFVGPDGVTFLLAARSQVAGSG